MAKITHTNYLDVVDTVWSSAKEKGIMHINSQEKNFDGTTFTIRDKELKNFGTCGYLGLETHPALIEGAISLTKKFGTQLSMSRAYIRPTYIQELEELISTIFNGNKAICFTSTSNAHISVLANIIKADDLIILDQQVHFSVQFPAKNTKLQGTEIKMVRHSNYEMLDQLLTEEANKYNRVWYLADGVYSMHGDLPDTARLKLLMNKHPKLHLYFDDAHGMSWDGKNGAGYIFDRLGVSKKIIIISTLAKGFGCVGGTAIFSDPEMYRRVDIFGGPLSYSHPLSPANVGAAIASAKIHLTDEIYQYQTELKDLTNYMSKRLLEKNLPNLSAPNSPIYFIGSGLNKVTLNLVHRVLEEGIYINTAMFPVVPNDKSGLRFTITRHNTKADIDELADAIAYHLPKAIQEENDKIERVYLDFGFTYTGDAKDLQTSKTTELILEEYNSIQNIDTDLWNFALKDRGNITHSGMQCMEEIFTNNEEPENNWTFHYPVIKDKTGKLICTTFFTGAIYKDDMLSRENISKQIEEERKKNPYYLCSKTLAMGSMFAEGNFIYLDTTHPEWKDAMALLFQYVEKIKKEINATVVLFRDFEEGHILNKLLEDEGYVKLRMPNSNKIQNQKWKKIDDLLLTIESSRTRKNIRQYALRYENLFDITVKNKISDVDSKRYFDLFSNIKDKNFAFNFFKYPQKIASILSKYDDYEFIDITLKDSSETICSIWCFIGENHYSPLIMGLNYDYTQSHHIYQQAVFQTVKRATQLNKKNVYLGFSADFEKQKYKAIAVPTFAFMKVDDTYNLELIDSYSNLNEIAST